MCINSIIGKGTVPKALQNQKVNFNPVFTKHINNPNHSSYMHPRFPIYKLLHSLFLSSTLTLTLTLKIYIYTRIYIH